LRQSHVDGQIVGCEGEISIVNLDENENGISTDVGDRGVILIESENESGNLSVSESRIL
jgi:hypothetical protein